MLLLLFHPQGVLVTGIDFREVVAELAPMLNAGAIADLEEWTEAELYEWADEAAKQLARSYGVFVERDAGTVVVAGTAVYAVPARHLSTIHASLGSLALYPLTVQELDALDATWPATEGTPDSFLTDADGVENTRLFPKPIAGGTMALVFHRYPAGIDAVSFLLTAPQCLQEYFGWHVLAEARGKESNGRMPEVAEHYRARVELLEELIEAYWGEAQ